MGKDSKPKDGGKGKGKQAAGGADDSKGKGKGGKSADGLGTCTYVKARHILCEKQGKINEAYKKLQDGWLSNGDKVPQAEFSKIAAEYSECPSGKKGGDLGWFPRGKMAGPFQEVAFNTPVGVTSAPFKSTYAFNFLLLKLLHQQVFGSFGSLAVSFPHIIAYVSCFYDAGMDTT
ncbi:peptidyl-prolyl cis-trans isomerase [Citrus sinensis]|nr:peptidyl-prolyl cis-trans isomerase [Citrus sinensis]